jgi:integrase
MPRYRDQDFTLFPRKQKSATIWNYYSYDNNGQRSNPVSTGIGYTRERDKAKSRREAEAYCKTLSDLNALKNSSAPTLQEWVTSKHFWEWDKSSYISGILMRSAKNRPRITESFCLKAEQVARDRILPFHGRKPIDNITPHDCEQLLFSWAKIRSNKTANNWKSVYSTILGEYERELKMKNPKADFFNPWKMVSALGTDKNKYGGLSIAEVQRILSLEGINLKSDKERIYYTAVKLAFLTGLRIGEVCGLITDNVCDHDYKTDKGELRMSYLEVTHQWHRKLKKRTLVKDKGIRQIPISAELRSELEIYMNGRGLFVFSFHPRQETPITDNRLRDWFYKRMIAVKITDRKDRNIAFHSTRRFFNTLLSQARVDKTTIQRFTGHGSDEMTEHYTDYLPEDLQAISRAQSRFLMNDDIKY